MKIYFTNHKYLNIDSFWEDYRYGNRYLNFSINNTSLSFDSLFNFLNKKENLTYITIVNDKGEVLEIFENVYNTLFNLNRSVESNEVIHITAQLSSSLSSQDEDNSSLKI